MSKFPLIVLSSLLFAMGLVMIFSTTSAEVLDHVLARSTSSALFKQLLFALAGCLFGVGIYRLGLERLLQYSAPLFWLFTILLVLTLIPGIGRVVNGSRRWLSLGGISFQPSEFVKYVLPLFAIYRLRQWEAFHPREFFKLASLLAIPIFLILVEPNNGTAAVIVMTLVVLVALTEVPLRYWMYPLLVFALIAGVSAYRLPYVSARIKVYLNPELDIKGKGHQPYQAKIAAGSGKFVGRGAGNSLQKLSYLPEAQNDYIVAIFAEEWGFLGMLALIALYMGFAYFGFRIAYLSKSVEGAQMAAAITFLICFQAFLNMGVVSGLLPSTGLNLPFFSQGGTSLVANIMGLSLLIHVGQMRQEHLID